MRKALVVLASAIFFGVSCFAIAANAANHKFPDCHGKNSVPCRPDPQPSHGKDCLKHGKGGINEDHCVRTSPSPTPTPTVTPTPSPTGTPTPVPSVHTPEPPRHRTPGSLALTGVGYEGAVLIGALGLAFLLLGIAISGYRRH